MNEYYIQTFFMVKLLFYVHDRLLLLGVPLRLRFETSLRASEPLSDILLTSESDILNRFNLFFI